MHMNDLKAELRRQAYDARNAQQDKDQLSRIICEKFTAQPSYRQSETVMWYIHCRSEVRTIPAIVRALDENKKTVIPYCTRDIHGNKVLGLWRLEDLSELVPGTWGIPEPPRVRWDEPGRKVHPKSLDLIMVPGVGFDRQGGRIGNGAGYYDRLLESVRDDAVLNGVCYETQLFSNIPMDVHDIYMDAVITDQKVYSGKGRG